MTESTIEFAWLSKGVAVIRVKGRGSFQNSMELQKITEKLREQTPLVRFIIDLDECQTMDSTFMGTLAGISVEQNKAGAEYLTVLNAREHTHKLLHNLGLSYILDMREEPESLPVKEEDFQRTVTGEEVSQFEQIIHMIKAHKQLIDLDSKNEIRFESVIKYLEDSLEREKGIKKDPFKET